MKIKDVIGIDASKLTLDCCLPLDLYYKYKLL